MPTYLQLDPQEQSSVDFELKSTNNFIEEKIENVVCKMVAI